MENRNESIKKWLNINVILIAVNVLVWLIMCVKGDTRSAQFMYEHGAMYPPDVLSGEWYRLISAMFLHFGAEHLISNMFMQYFLGDMLLRALSQWKFALIYVLAGIGGNVTSLVMMLLTGEWKKAGVYTVEEFNPEPFLDALDKYGLPRRENHNPTLVD